MESVTIRRSGGALLHLWSDAAGQGCDVPAGPCVVTVPAWAAALVLDAEIVAAPTPAPADDEE